jgi:hypothetical protein
LLNDLKEVVNFFNALPVLEAVCTALSLIQIVLSSNPNPNPNLNPNPRKQKKILDEENQLKEDTFRDKTYPR